MRSTSLIAVLSIGAVAVGMIGCASSAKPGGTPLERAWEAPARPETAPRGEERSDSKEVSVQREADRQPESEPTRAAQPLRTDEILAFVNGTPIRRAEVVDLLIASHGLGILEHLILLEAARKRAAEMSLEVTRQDIEAAHEDALRRLATPMGGSQAAPLDEQAAKRLLQGFLAAKNISQREWEWRMEQRAYLAKIAEAEVAKMTVTEQMLREEYERAYGEKVQVRHIQLESLAAVTRVRALLARKDFELVARQHSENDFTAAHGGLMPPFTRNDPDIPPLICEMAFGLEVGQVSPAIQEQSRYHLIRLERRFPASDVGFENVDKDALRKRLLDRLTDQRLVALEGELFQSAAVDIRDKALNRQFRERHRGKRGQARAP